TERKSCTIFPTGTSLSALSLPALAEDAPAPQPAAKAAQADEPGKATEAPKATADATAAPTAKPATADTATAETPKRTSLAAAPTSHAGAESSAASSEWKTDFHGYFRVPFRMGMGTRPAPTSVPSEASQSEANTGTLAP